MYGGTRLDRPGLFFEPTVFSGVDDHMWIAKEESFGPIMIVSSFPDGLVFIAQNIHLILHDNERPCKPIETFQWDEWAGWSIAVLIHLLWDAYVSLIANQRLGRPIRNTLRPQSR